VASGRAKMTIRINIFRGTPKKKKGELWGGLMKFGGGGICTAAKLLEDEIDDQASNLVCKERAKGVGGLFIGKCLYGY